MHAITHILGLYVSGANDWHGADGIDHIHSGVVPLGDTAYGGWRGDD